MRYILTSLFLVFAHLVIAQIKPNFFPEDIPATGVEQMCFCKPGVSNKSKSRGFELSYTWRGRSNYISEEDDSSILSTFNNLQNIKFSVKIPIIYKGGFTFILGYKLLSDFYHFEQIGNKYADAFREMDNRTLKSNAIDAIVTKSLGESRYMAARLGYASNGNYSRWADFDPKYSIYKFLGLYAIKPNDDFEWGFGLTGSFSFRRTSLIPFLVYNKTYDEHWGIESIFPGYIYGRYNLNETNIFLFGVEYDSKSYRLDVSRSIGDNLDYALNQSAVIFSLRLEHQFSSWVWANIKAGYRVNLDSEFLDKNANTPRFDADVSDAPFIQLGIFITPPDSVRENL